VSEVRILESAEEVERYRELIRYCFSDEFSRTAPIFSFMSEADKFYGLYEKETLESGVISRHFNASLWGRSIKLNGITYVASSPEVRNKGHIRTLMTQILRDAYQSGYTASALYPFSFQFYGKFGYGSAGPVYKYQFAPEDVNKDLMSQAGGSFEPLNSGRESLEKAEKIELFSQRFVEAEEITNRWAEKYSFGIELPFSAEQLRRYLGTQNEYAYIYRSLKGEATAFIQYSMKPVGEDSFNIEVQRFSYLNGEGLRALMGFLARHRGQCPQVVLYGPSDLPISLMMKEPRTKTTQLSEWMVRPLDLLELLKMKVGQSGFKGTIRFSLQDPVIEENTATYTINSGDVSVAAFSGENQLPFESFSSLLSGAYSWSQMAVVGKVPSADEGLLDPKAEEEFSRLFAGGPPVMISEPF